MLECNLAVGLNKREIISDILAQYDESSFEGAGSRTEWLAAGVQNIFFLKKTSNTSFLNQLFNLISIIKKNRYTHVISSNTGFDTLVSLANRIVKFKHIVACHTYFSKESIDTLRIKFWRFIVKKTVYKFYCITAYVMENVLNFTGLPIEKFEVVYNSLELKSVKNNHKVNFRKQLKISDDAKIILIVGRIEKRKGHDIAIEILASKLKTNPNLYLAFAGEYFEGNAIESGLNDFNFVIEELINKHGIRNKIIFLGFQNDIQLIMEESDLLLHLARHEGFGLVLLEAILFGLPIVASNSGGIPEVLAETPYKVFSLEEKDEILTEILTKLSITDLQKQTMIEEAKEILNKFSSETRVGRIIDLMK